MSLSSRAQATVLLTVPLAKSEPNGPRVLSIGEWNRLASWMKHRSINPENLFRGAPKDLLTEFRDETVTPDRVQRLLDRGFALGLALEKWQRMGIWVLTRADPDYPNKLKERIGAQTAPVLFGCGNKSLLNTPGIAVIGSREASPEDCEKAFQYGKLAADQGYSIISGGARGIDTCAANGALDEEGTVIVVLPNGLSKSSTSTKYRDCLMSKNLLLLSPTHPESPFNVGFAMARNRYIYGLSSSAIVVCSTRNSGGTWAGALENIQNKWVPTWVCKTDSELSGNESLVNRGARWLPEPFTSINGLLEPNKEDEVGLDLAESEPDHIDGTRLESINPTLNEGNLYQVFLEELARIASSKPLSREDIASNLLLTRSQTDTWLKQGVDSGQIQKLTRPIRYLFVSDLFSHKPNARNLTVDCKKSTSG